MEQQQTPQGGELRSTQEQIPNQCGESWDEYIIHTGIEAAEEEQREIDDRTARYIASQLHGGQGSALYSLASCGVIDEERIVCTGKTGPVVGWLLRWIGSRGRSTYPYIGNQLLLRI